MLFSLLLNGVVFFKSWQFERSAKDQLKLVRSV